MIPVDMPQRQRPCRWQTFSSVHKSLWAMVFLRLRRRQVATMAVAEIRFNGVFLQMFLDMCPLSLFFYHGFRDSV